MRAMDVMTSEVITVDEDASVQSVAKLMANHGISAVPVVDKDNRVIGMVSEGDLASRRNRNRATALVVARNDGVDQPARRGIPEVA